MPKPIIKQTEQGPILTDGELSLQINFFSSQHNYRRQTAGIKNQLIAKAVGIKGDYRPYIIDATAGLGRDAFVLASLGCKVLMLEQSTELNILLQHALQAAEKKQEIHRIIQGMSLIETNSIDYFKSLKKEDYPEVIYLDPMFPERKKSALVKKEMQLLQKLLDKTEDNTLLLDSALACATKRVVIKRPRLAPAYAERSPSFCLTGKSCRFDVHVRTEA